LRLADASPSVAIECGHRRPDPWRSNDAMKLIRPGYILPSAALTVPPRAIRGYEPRDAPPAVGDLVYGRIQVLGHHGSLENKHGRIHEIHDGTRAVYVWGNRYAPDAFEALVPDRATEEADLIARSGIVSQMVVKNAEMKDPTRVKLLGSVLDEQGQALNTLRFPLAKPRNPINTARRRSPMILHVGTSMNSGKSTSAMACCWALSAMGHAVRASKVTGTASLKDILHMQDAGAERVSDFSHLGFPSTYMLDPESLIGIFRDLDAKFANNPKKFWVVEFADGILQRETAALLRDEYVRSRIHKLIFSAGDALGAVGGMRVLEDEFGLRPDAVSGRCSSSPLSVRELQERTKVPVFNNVIRDLKQLSEILL
jgi:hypothetical protein